MPSVNLEVQDATLSASYGSGWAGDHPGKRILTLSVRLTRFEALQLKTGEKVEDVEFKLSFEETVPEAIEAVTKLAKEIRGWDSDALEQREQNAIGRMSYAPAWSDKYEFESHSPAINFWVYLPTEAMADLLRLAELGRFPKNISVEVKGLTYGGAPDGSQKKWLDNDKVPVLPILAVSYQLDVLPGSTRECAEAHATSTTNAPVIAMPPLGHALEWLKGAVALLAIIAAILVFRTWR